MGAYAEVAIPAGVDKLFTYLIPSELRAAARIGTRVLVPFGRKWATGLIVDLPSSSSLSSLKPLADVLDSEPVVSPELFRLCRWIADYYIAPLPEVLKAALPHGFSPVSKRRVHLATVPEDSTLRDLRKRSPKRAALLDQLIADGPQWAADLQKRTGLRSINAVLNDLAAQGLVRSEEVLARPAAKPKTREVLLLQRISMEDLERVTQQLSPRKRKAREVLDTILRWKLQSLDEIQILDLLKQCKTTSRVLKDIHAAIPLPVVRKEVHRQQEYGLEEQTLTILLNQQQQDVLQTITRGIDSHGSTTFLLHGVTGSGKTQVYIEAIRHCLLRGKTAVVLVPEISLTPQIVRRFKSHFGNQALVVHSRMGAGERHDVWRLARAGECRIVIGPRSAIFAPLEHLGLIIVDEEHESSYKQFDAVPRYHARDVAIMRAHDCGATIVLGSATPSVESFQNARSGKYTLLELPERVDHAELPVVQIVDMRLERQRAYQAMKEGLLPEARHRLRAFQSPSISAVLREKIAERLERSQGIILLQNRRGFAPFVECPECGYVEMCSNCQITLTYHRTKGHLRCHYCGLTQRPHILCPQCGNPDIALRGVGTQRVEDDLHAAFPGARIARMDLDTTTRKGSHDRILRSFAEGSADILLGTQMIAKGLDFPHVTLVGVISADTQMLLPDFRSSERTFQLLTQVSGRAGRSHLRGEVVIQTFQPDHYSLRHVVDHDYHSFFEEELKSRNELSYPPASRIVLVEMRGSDEDAVRNSAETLGDALKRSDRWYTMLGPSPAAIGKISNQYRWHILLKSLKEHDPAGAKTREALRSALQEHGRTIKRKAQIIVDIDPVGIM